MENLVFDITKGFETNLNGFDLSIVGVNMIKLISFDKHTQNLKHSKGKVS